MAKLIDELLVPLLECESPRLGRRLHELPIRQDQGNSLRPGHTPVVNQRSKDQLQE
jgi:hypothetical protein